MGETTTTWFSSVHAEGGMESLWIDNLEISQHYVIATRVVLQGTCYVGNPYSWLVHTLNLVPSSCTLCQPVVIVSTVQLA